ncbi:MAG: polysaccharide deacetylase family protein [Oscillatoriales cyanobacterium]|nr:MAG: polysaccharide deacetylase family protein [Oscillatoriales cyanobacterium]
MTRLFSKRSASTRSRSARPLSLRRRSRLPWQWLILAVVTCLLAVSSALVWNSAASHFGSSAIGTQLLNGEAAAAQQAPPLSLGDALDRSIQNFQKRLTTREQEVAIALGGPPPAFAGKLIRDIYLPSNEKAVALTFDDGPMPVYTEQILDILKRENVKATFFVIGRMFQSNPKIGQRVAQEGHLLANHTWTHPYHRHSPAAAASEIDRTTNIVTQYTGQVPRFYRPPGGVLNNGLDRYAQSKGYTTTLWGADTGDWRRPAPSVIVSRVMNNVHPGSIVLMHDGGGKRDNTVAALPVMIAQLKAQGYRFVTLSELLQLQVRSAQPQQAAANPEPAPPIAPQT